MTQTHPIDACCKTDTGLKRSQNEDVCAANMEYNFFMVADGMGGAAKGDLASKFFLTATEKIFTALEKTPTLKERFYACFDDGQEGKEGEEKGQNKVLNLVKDKTYACFENANNTIQEHIKKIPTHAGMGCTAELLTFFEQYYIIGHVGDSRSYLLSADVPLRQITKDHSLIQTQIDNGAIQEKQASNMLKNVLTRAIGVSPHLEVDIISGQGHPGDIFLLCSDGLYNMVTDKEIEDVLAFDAPLDLKAEILINMANDNGGRDNISVTLVQIPAT